MLRKIKYKPVYRTYNNCIEKEFYVPSYYESLRLNRAAGYFSLYSLLLSIDGIIRFIRNKGQINIICSPDLSQSDAELIDACLSLDKEHITKSLIESIVGSLLSEDEIGQMDIICNMLSDGILKIKIAYMPLGIFHEKFGIFIDSDHNMVYFNGSLNETKRALEYNHESIRVDWTWRSAEAKLIIENENAYFESLWNNQVNSVCVIDFPEAVKNELFNRYKRSETLITAIDNYIQGNSSKKGKKNLYNFQEDAITQFFNNNGRHFYEMATGTGKTFTSIKTIERLRGQSEEKLFVVICVPQIDLQSQWERALNDEGFDKVYLFGGNGNDYDRTISEASIAFHTEDKDVVCVSVYDTFFAKVYQKIRNISNFFIIVDEAHNLTQGNINILKQLKPRYRLGLSATIERYHEEESLDIRRFFSEEPPFHFGIEEAIENGFLSKYEYHPIFVHLTEDEQERFALKTRLLAQEIDKEEPDSSYIERLSRERSLILKQASEKIEKLSELADKGYNFVNSVVYCGQGKDSDGDSIIDNVTRVLYNHGLVVSQFTSKTQDRKKVLYEFEHGYYDTLAAIKCFDEGVDVPKLDKLYIMASDSSLRQTVQRRGRVLRKCKESGKTIAYIYDMVVLPAISVGTYGCDSLLSIEFPRAQEYNRLALNKDDNDKIFQELQREYHITNTEEDYESESD